jgi:drug/metabolite transporter (DMT)-like permease
MLGIALISFGLISITLLGGKIGRISPQALRWGLATSVMIASYTVTDGLGVRAAGNSYSYILWLFVFEPFPICITLLLIDRHGWFSYMRNKPGKIVMGGLASSTAYALVIFAMGLGSMAMVSSLRETSVIFAALIGTLMFREPFGRRRIIAAIVVCLGVVLIKLLG